MTIVRKKWIIRGKRTKGEKGMHQYPSDISREEYGQIQEDLEAAKKKARPRKYDLYDVFCAVLYVVQGGIQWRMLPSDYPKCQTVYYYFRVWSETDETGISILDKVLKKLVKQIRNEDLRRDKTTFGIVDAQSVQNADTAEEKGFDAGKNIRNQTSHCCRYDGAASRRSRNNR